MSVQDFVIDYKSLCPVCHEIVDGWETFDGPGQAGEYTLAELARVVCGPRACIQAMHKCQGHWVTVQIELEVVKALCAVSVMQRID